MEAQQHTIETNSMHGVFCADSESVNHSNSLNKLNSAITGKSKCLTFCGSAKGKQMFHIKHTSNCNH